MSELLLEGVEIMLIGMGTVFVFLGLLVIATSTMSRLITQMQGEPEPVAQRAAPAATNNANGVEDPALLAAISAAVHQFRRKHNK